ncbi:hypothetical protein C8Q77DRAFT_1061280 [Trametes polyzona]|nr:hypothetical protein C8Q77DRAFT_1061280 [Trametes polyzona]
MAPPAVVNDLDTFFPLPSPAPSAEGPVRFPGVTAESSAVLAEVLKDNHVKWHAFFNDRGFHNHASHHLVAIYALGAGGPLIKAAYETHVSYLLPALESPEKITEKNFFDHLGKRDFYNSYLEYFRELLRKKDITDVLEEYFFSTKANAGGAGIEGQPKLLGRLLAGLVHPLIHAGNGLEFGFLGLVAEGFAQAAVHEVQGTNLVPRSLLEHKDGGAITVERLTALLPSLSLSKKHSGGKGASGKKGVHAFSILARVLADDKFSPAAVGIPAQSNFERVNNVVGDALAALAAEWVADLAGDGATPAAISKKVEELTWVNSIIYGIGGWGARNDSQNKKFKADFFYMHLVTSAIFLPSFIAYLSPRSATLLLESYFATSITCYVSQGRVALPIREFFEATTAKPTPPQTNPPPTKGKRLTPEDPVPNTWLPIIDATLTHPGEHVCKLQRALAHNAVLYGTRPAGYFAGTELKDAELLDGTLFIRTAGLTADRVGWVMESERFDEWDRSLSF